MNLKKYRVFEPATKWHQDITAKSPEQAIDKAWFQTWEKILKSNGFLHFKKEALEVREL